MSAFVRFIYSIIIAVAIVMFVGFGVYAFYPGPEPAYSICYDNNGYYEDSSGKELELQRKQEEKCIDREEAKSQAHARNVTITGLGVTLILGAGYMYLSRRSNININEVVMDGLGLGLIGLGFYNLTWSGIAGPHRIMMFVAAVVLLVSAIGVGFTKFSDKES